MSQAKTFTYDQASGYSMRNGLDIIATDNTQESKSQKQT